MCPPHWKQRRLSRRGLFAVHIPIFSRCIDTHVHMLTGTWVHGYLWLLKVHVCLKL